MLTLQTSRYICTLRKLSSYVSFTVVNQTLWKIVANDFKLHNYINWSISVLQVIVHLAFRTSMLFSLWHMKFKWKWKQTASDVKHHIKTQNVYKKNTKNWKSSLRNVISKVLFFNPKKLHAFMSVNVRVNWKNCISFISKYYHMYKSQVCHIWNISVANEWLFKMEYSKTCILNSA